MKTIAILSLLLLCGCRSNAETVAVRHADSVGTLRSASASTIDKVETWETIVMRADTAGRLVPISRDIVRHTEKATESALRDDSGHYQTTTEELHREEKKTTAEAKETTRTRTRTFVAGVWVGFTAVVLAFAAYLLKQWKR